MLGTSKSISGFDPRTVPGCQLWLDAADTTTLILSGSNVTAWTDKSPLATPFTLSNGSGGSTIRTTYTGLPVVQVSNSCFYNASYSYPLATRSIFFVMAETVHSDWRGLLSFANTVGQSDYNTQNGYTITSTNTVGSNVQFSQNAGNGGFVFNYNASNGSKDVPFQLYEDVTSNTAVTMFITGSNVYSSNTSVAPLTSTGLTVGGRGGIPNTGALVIAEVLLYNNVLTTSQRQQVEGYLAHKWGLNTTYPAMTPLTIPGCQLWLDAADSSTITGTTSVTAWRDKSTNGYSANSFVNSVAYPSLVSNVQNGNSVIQYSAGNGSSIANFVLAQTMSIFMVYYPINQSTDGPFLEHGPDTNSTSGLYFHAQNGNNFSINSGSGQVAVNFGTTAVSNTWQMIEGINPDPANGNTMAYYVNGTTKVSGGIQSGTTTLTKTLYINGRGGANNLSYNTYLAELIIFNIAVTTTQRQTIEGYLAKKWGITSMYLVLPSTHPFSSVRPHLRPFQPTDVPGCLLWLDGADTGSMTLSGSSVTQWRDKSGRGFNVATSSGATAPVYNSSTKELQFVSGNSNSFTIPQGFGDALVGTTFSFFFIGRRTVNTTYVYFLSGATSAGNQNLFIGFLSNKMEIGEYGPYASADIPTFNSPDPMRLYYYDIQSSTTANLIMNGNPLSTTVSGNLFLTSFAQPELGRRYGGAVYHDFNLSEMIAFSPALNASQRQQVEGYLAHKWGLTPTYATNTPLSIPGCQLWLDGADSSTVTFSSGSNVNQWSDKSGNGRNATVYNGTPTYTVSSGMTFNGSSTLQVTYPASPTVETLFMIIKFNSVSGQSSIFAGTAVGQREYLLYSPYSPGTMYLGRYGSAPSGSINGGTVTTGTTYMLNYVFNGTGNTISFYQSGTVTSSGAPQFTYGAGGTITLIGSYGGGGFLQGQIYEILVYNTALTTTQRQTIENYLARKWGLTVSGQFLSTHPFRSIPPAILPFSPRNISGLQLWLDAADQGSMALSGSSVTVWNDKSGNGYHMNTLPASASWSGIAAYPTIGTSMNGLQTVKFLAQSGLKQATTLDGAKNLFWVGRIAAPDGTAGPDAASVYFLLGHDTLYDWHGDFYGSKFVTTGVAQSGITSATASLFTSDANAVTNATFGNVNMPSAPNVSLLSVSGITGSTRYQGICYDRNTHPGWCGDLAEVLIYSTALTTSQRQQVEGYLAQKWGLTGSLPSSHPFKKLPA